jgi:hypothetical protein
MIYPHTITVIKAIRVQSSIGGTSIEHPGDGYSARAFVQPQRESLSVVNEIGGYDMVATVYAEPSANIEANDRMIFESRTYEFTGSINQYSRTGSHHIKAVARLLDVES